MKRLGSLVRTRSATAATTSLPATQSRATATSGDGWGGCCQRHDVDVAAVPLYALLPLLHILAVRLDCDLGAGAFRQGKGKGKGKDKGCTCGGRCALSESVLWVVISPEYSASAQ